MGGSGGRGWGNQKCRGRSRNRAWARPQRSQGEGRKISILRCGAWEDEGSFTRMRGTAGGAAGDARSSVECVRYEVPVRYPEETENNYFLEIAIV